MKGANGSMIHEALQLKRYQLAVLLATIRRVVSADNEECSSVIMCYDITI